MKQIVNSIPKPTVQPVVVSDVQFKKSNSRLGLKAYPNGLGHNYFKYILTALDNQGDLDMVAFIRDDDDNGSTTTWDSANSVEGLVKLCLKDDRCEVFIFDSNVELAKWILEK